MLENILYQLASFDNAKKFAFEYCTFMVCGSVWRAGSKRFLCQITTPRHNLDMMHVNFMLYPGVGGWNESSCYYLLQRADNLLAGQDRACVIHHVMIS